MDANIELKIVGVLKDAGISTETLNKVLPQINEVITTYRDPFAVQVKEFHDAFEHPAHPFIMVADEDVNHLRVKLLREEVDELDAAIRTGNIVEIADALADIEYVTKGAVHTFGMASMFPDIFADVHDSNMTKACYDEASMQESLKKHISDGHLVTVIEKEDSSGTPITVLTNQFGKVLKNVNYRPAAPYNYLPRGTVGVIPLYTGYKKSLLPDWKNNLAELTPGYFEVRSFDPHIHFKTMKHEIRAYAGGCTHFWIANLKDVQPLGLQHLQSFDFSQIKE